VQGNSIALSVPTTHLNPSFGNSLPRPHRSVQHPSSNPQGLHPVKWHNIAILQTSLTPVFGAPNFRRANNQSVFATEFRIARRQSLQQTLAIVAMTNRRLVATPNVPASTIPRSLPEQPESQIAFSAEKAVAKYNGNGNISPPTPTSLNGDSGSPSEFPAFDHAFMPPPALSYPSFGPSANPSSLANALRAINDGSITIPPVRRPPSVEGSPYTKSLSSTAPTSPRM
jgi:hypothetical protein